MPVGHQPAGENREVFTVGPRVAPQHSEGVLHRQIERFAQESLGLLYEHPAGQRTYAALLTTAISAFVCAIAIGSLITIARHVNTARLHQQ
mgnify:CR=1 FL=1